MEKMIEATARITEENSQNGIETSELETLGNQELPNKQRSEECVSEEINASESKNVNKVETTRVTFIMNVNIDKTIELCALSEGSSKTKIVEEALTTFLVGKGFNPTLPPRQQIGILNS